MPRDPKGKEIHLAISRVCLRALITSVVKSGSCVANTHQSFPSLLMKDATCIRVGSPLEVSQRILMKLKEEKKMVV